VETNELIKKVRKIEIKTRGLSQHVFAGRYHSAFKGRGMAFSEVREYSYGDDIRNIDWNVTARLNHPYVKVFEEERELTVMLLIDVSASGLFGTQSLLKKDLMAEVAGLLSFSAIQNNDKIGVILFSDKVEKCIPPKKGRQHILHIIRELIEFQPSSNKTSVAEALRFLNNAIKKRSIAFVMSDFIDTTDRPDKLPFEDALKIANRKHDVVALRIYDKHEKVLPKAGLIRFTDAESGQVRLIDTSDATVREAHRNWWYKFDKQLSETFTRCRVDVAEMATGDDYVKALLRLFNRRN